MKKNRSLQPGDVGVIMRPITDDEGNWQEYMSVGLAFGEAACEEGMQAALNVAIGMAALPRLLEDNPDLEGLLEEYKAEFLKEYFPEAWEEASKEVEAEELNAEPAVSSDGKVISLSSWSKTWGSA